MKKKILIGILILLIVIQFIKPPHNAGIAEASTDITHVVQVPDTVLHLLKASCYDCHSNHTNYPWYSKITPVNWWLYNHIENGKKHLNYTTFATGSFKRKSKKLEETAELIEKQEMPLKSYLWQHPEAKLNAGQRALLINWAKAAKQQVLQDSVQSQVH